LKHLKNEYLLFFALAAIYAACLFFSPFSFFAGFFVPYVFLCFTAANKNGRFPYVFMSWIAIAGAATVSFHATAVFLISAILPALIIMLCHKGGRRYSWKAVILNPLPVTAFIAAVFILMPEIPAKFEMSVIELIERTFAAMNTANPENLNMKDVFLLYFEQRYEIASLTVSLSPAFIYSSLALVVYVTEKIFYKIPSEEILSLPDFLLLIVILSGLCMTLTFMNLRTVGMNGIIITGTLYFMRGFDIVRYYMNRWRIVLFVRTAIYLTILIQFFFIAAVAVLGFFSIYKNPIKDGNSGNAEKSVKL
jgi:hypothetical protein